MTLNFSSVPRVHFASRIAWATLLLAFVLALGTILAFAIASRLDAATFDPAFCGPGSMHTTVEPPQTQLTRDYAAIRILLKDAGDHFAQIRRVYTGELHVAPAFQAVSLVRPPNRAKLFKAEYQRNPWAGSLRQEVQRVDDARGTTWSSNIDVGLQAGDQLMVETAFHEIFAALLDELLLAIQQRLDQSANVGRALHHARRYYSDGLDAHLSINAAAQAARANFSLDAMARAIDDIRLGRASGYDWFARERIKFMRAIREGLDTSVERQAT